MSKTEEAVRIRRSFGLYPSPAELVVTLLDDLLDDTCTVSKKRIDFVRTSFAKNIEKTFQPVQPENRQMSTESGSSDDSDRAASDLKVRVRDRYKPCSLVTGEEATAAVWRRQSVDIQPDPNAKTLLTAVDNADFNVFEFAETLGRDALFTLGTYILHREGLLTQFKLPKQKFKNYLQHIADGYSQHPYHNSTHACCVLHTTYKIFKEGGVDRTQFQPQAILACYLAAMTHDFDHPGTTTEYLIKTEDELAIRYNDISPLENYHVSAAWSLLMQEDLNFISMLSSTVKRDLRELWIELVMATDMKKHEQLLSCFRSQAICQQEELEISRSIILQMVVKMADLGHLALPLQQHKMWVGLLEEEFYRQGDLEKEKSLPVSKYMDREKPGISSSQIVFFESVALPAFEIFSAVFSDSRAMTSRVQRNYKYWQQIKKAGINSN